MSDTLLLARKDGKYGIVGLNQNQIVPFKYDDIKYQGLGFSRPHLLLQQGSDWIAWDFIKHKDVLKGDLIEPHSITGLVPVYLIRRNSKWGISTLDEELVEPKFELIEVCSGDRDYLFVTKDSKKAIYDLKIRSFISDFIFDDIVYTTNLSAVVSQKPNKGLFDLSLKKYLLPIGFNDIELMPNRFYEDVRAYSVTKHGKMGVTDSRGKIIIPLEYTKIESFGANFYAVQEKGKWGLVNIKNPTVKTEIKYNDIKAESPNKFKIDGKKYKFIGEKLIEIKGE